MKKFRIHPICELFPKMPDDQFAELVESIKKKGGRLKIDFAPLPDDDFIDVDIGDNGPPTVIANSNHPFVARYRESADKTLFLSNLMTAFIYEVNRHNCQHSLFDAVNGCPQKRLATALTRIAEPVAAS